MKVSEYKRRVAKVRALEALLDGDLSNSDRNMLRAIHTRKSSRVRLEEEDTLLLSPEGWASGYDRKKEKADQKRNLALTNQDTISDYLLETFLGEMQFNTGRVTVVGRPHGPIRAYILYHESGRILRLTSPEEAFELATWYLSAEGENDHYTLGDDEKDPRYRKIDLFRDGKMSFRTVDSLRCLLTPEEADDLILCLMAWAQSWEMTEQWEHLS